MKEGYKERRAAKHEAEKAKREEGWYPIHIIVGQAYPRADIAARAARLGGLFTLAEAQMELLLCLPEVTPDEVHAFLHGPLHLTTLREGNMLGLAARFGDQLSYDGSY